MQPTERLHAGAPLSAATAEIARRFGVRSRVLPMSDDRVRTFVKTRGREPLPFQEYFVRGRRRGAIEAIELRGIDEARPLPSVLEAIREAAGRGSFAEANLAALEIGIGLARR